jgi:phenylacetate-CoA ligase
MNMKRMLYKFKIRALAKLARRTLRSISSEKLRRRSRQQALRAFGRAAARTAAYRQILQHAGVKADTIRSPEDFRSLPLTDKQSLFGAHDIRSLCVDGRVDDLACVYTSSGHSKKFSFGLETHKQMHRGAEDLDLMLELYLGVSKTPTLLVNALPMGVQVPCRLPIKLDTSVRADAVLAVLAKMHPICPQKVIVGEHHFLKKVIEAGRDEGIDWPAHRVSIVTGAENMPESYRTYIGNILGHDPDRPEKGRILVSAGISEVGLTVGHETDACRAIRKAAGENPALARALFGFEDYLPTLVQYMPTSYYMETVEQDGLDRLVVTTCQADRRIPLIRYNTRDWARLLEYEQVVEALQQTGLEHLRPDWQLPFLALFGRGEGKTVSGRAVYPEQVKEALYAEPSLAPHFTANFRMRSVPGGKALSLRMQLAPGKKPSEAPVATFTDHMQSRLGVEVRTEMVAYDQFTEALELCYQRKFRYLG